MRVLLTGAGGFVGSQLLGRFLRDRDHEVLVLLRPGRRYPRIDHLLGDVEVLSGDLAHSEALAEPLRRFRPEIVVHSAWALPSARNRNSVDHVDHVAYTGQLVKLAHEANAEHFIGIGSQAEYGPWADRNRTEAAPSPTTVYGTAKLCAGLLADAACRSFAMRFAWLRLFSAYGPGEDPEWLLPALCAKFLAKERPLTTRGEQVYDYLFVADAAEAIYQVAVKPQASGFFDLGSGRGHQIRELIERMRDLIDPSLTVGFGDLPYPPDQVMRMEANVDRLVRTTGWRPRIDLDTGLRYVVDWVRRNGQRTS